MKMLKYRLGFIGGGIDSIAGYPHLIASQMDNRFEVVAGVFSSNDENNQKTAKCFGIKNTYSSAKEMIDDKSLDLDAIVILTPTPNHFTDIRLCLENDIPIICEKPFVKSLQEAQELEKIYDHNKHFLVVTNNYSGYPMVRELKERISNGEIGDILQIRLSMPQESFLRPPKSVKYPQKWRLKDDYIPMISLDLGSHLHHLAYFLTDKEPQELNAIYNKFSKYNVVDDVNISLKYDDFVANMWFSKVALGNRNGLKIEVYGSKASATWFQESPEKLKLSYNDGKKIILDRGSDTFVAKDKIYNRMTPGHPAGFIEAFANLYNDIANSLDNFYNSKEYIQKYVFGFDHAYNGIKLLQAASISNEELKWIKLSNI